MTPIGSISPLAALPLPPVPPTSAAPAVNRPDFGGILAQGLEKVQGLQTTSDDLAVKAATGDLTDIHDYMIASTAATTATQLTVAVRNKAVEAFTEIMRMQM